MKNFSEELRRTYLAGRFEDARHIALTLYDLSFQQYKRASDKDERQDAFAVMNAMQQVERALKAIII